MASLVKDPNFLDGLSATLMIIVMVLGLVYAWRKKLLGVKPKTCCPGCQREGEIQGWGNFHCRHCRRDFMVDEQGAVIGSITKPYRRYALVNILLYAGIIGVYIAMHSNHFPEGMTVVMFPMLVLSLRFPLIRKPFPRD